MITAAPGVRARASASRASSESSADSATTTASGAPDAAGTDPAARASSASPITKIVGSFLASATIKSIAAASAVASTCISCRMPAKAFITSRPRVRERRNPASRLTCARKSASTSGSGRGSTDATSRRKAAAQRPGSLSVMRTMSVKGRSSRDAASASFSPSSSRVRNARSNDSSARRASASAVDSTSSTKPSLASAEAILWRSTGSGSATRKRSCPPRAALRRTPMCRLAEIGIGHQPRVILTGNPKALPQHRRGRCGVRSSTPVGVGRGFSAPGP